MSSTAAIKFLISGPITHQMIAHVAQKAAEVIPCDPPPQLNGSSQAKPPTPTTATTSTVVTGNANSSGGNLPTSHHHCITPPRRHNSYPLRESSCISLKPSMYNTPITPMSILTPNYGGNSKNNVFTNFPPHIHISSVKDTNNLNVNKQNSIITDTFLQSTPNCIEEFFPDSTSDDAQADVDMDTDEDEENQMADDEKRVIYDEPTTATFDELYERFPLAGNPQQLQSQYYQLKYQSSQQLSLPSFLPQQWNYQSLSKPTSPSTITANLNPPDAGVSHFPSYCSGRDNKMVLPPISSNFIIHYSSTSRRY
ncbi:10801_t:CDS:2 [Acaulospora colombiana]|uniref:10801_t:CDS:1 n=1 Tax=Acaulospora colombiana TaxID=27376 RepID=A0ACA9KSW9_9GLOM|nr:10801_t:CDS:2 [Acaulospora colombiana]